MPSASPTDSAPTDLGGEVQLESDLELNEMLKILDAASRLRKERTKATLALETDETKRLLRERLLEAARVSGERVDDAEVEAAIERYYGALHAFEPAEPGLERFLAGLYIRRRRITAIAGGIALWLGLMWWLFLSSSGPFSKSGRLERALGESMANIEASHAELTALAVDPSVDLQLNTDLSRARELSESGDVEELERLEKDMESLGQRLRLEYRVLVVSQPGKSSGVIRDFDQALSGHYLIVEAEGPGGKAVRLPVRSAETDRTRVVSTWGEWVPQAVYERVANDKRADGIVDDRLVAEKSRGRLELQVRLLDDAGAPIQLRRQITEWDD